MSTGLRCAALASSIACCAASLRGQGLGTLLEVPGEVVDLAAEVGTQTSFLYGTRAGEVGRISPPGGLAQLASGVVGAPGQQLRALVSLPDANVAAVDDQGYLLRVDGGSPVTIYADLYMIQDATDLAVDADGMFLVASSTPTSGVRALNWISANGAQWAYYRVADQPLALCADPLGAGVVYTDAAGSGALRRVDTSDPAHGALPLESLAGPGFSAAALDGDIAAAANGDLYYAAGTRLWQHVRANATSVLLHEAGAPVRGLCVAASSGGVASASGWSLYFAQGADPSAIRELGDVLAPASPLAPPLGAVPGRGQQVWFTGSMNMFELATDAAGHLLVGGDLWGANPQLRRLTLPGFAATAIATAAHGLSDRIEGIALDAEGRIHVQSSSGVLQRVDEGPTSVVTLYDDAPGAVQVAKDLLLARSGAAWIADRSGYGSGAVYELAPGATMLATLVPTNESRGIAADAFGARALVTQWNGPGFVGSVEALTLTPPALATLASFAGMNYTNASSWADGDLATDAYGNVYTCSEDDWSVQRWERDSGKLVRIGSGYLNHPAGLAIAASSGQTPSATGWSLYVAEWNFLWELGGVPAPAPRLVDPLAPPAGRCAGFASPAAGEPLSLCTAADGSALYVGTALSRVLRIEPLTRVVSEVAGPAQGLQGELVALAPRPDGALLVAARDGRLWQLEAAPSHAVALLHDDAAGALADVRGACLDALGRPVLLERPAGGASRLYRLDGGTAQLLVHAARGLRPALDPFTGELWLTEQGAQPQGPYANAGELLRVDGSVAPARAGHLGQYAYTTLVHGDFDGGLAFDAAGDVYASESGSGRVWKLRRDGGPRALVAGNYDAPRGVALASGTPGVAGAQGYSLYVLDRWAVYEHGIDGAPAPLLPASATSAIEFSVEGITEPGTQRALRIEAPADAGRTYLILPTLSGHLPGLPLAVLGDPLDPRVLPLNFDIHFGTIFHPSLMAGYVGMLDASGNAAPNAALKFPDNPTLLQLDAWIGLCWIALDPGAPNGVATVGATAQLYLGP